MLDQFMKENIECLPPLPRRLREDNPSRLSLICAIRAVLPVVAKHALVSIDGRERGHAAMRVDLQSDGRGRSFTGSANRVVSRELLAEHIARGGVMVGRGAQAVLDVSRGGSEVLVGDRVAAAAGLLAPAPAVPAGPPAQRAQPKISAHPGNPFSASRTRSCMPRSSSSSLGYHSMLIRGATPWTRPLPSGSV